MTNFIQDVLQISITMAAVIGVLLLLVPVWQKRYSAKWRKAIWLIIAVRLLVPFSIELPTAPVQMNVDMHQAIVLSPQSVPTDTAPVPAIPSQIETPDNVTVSTTVNNITPTITTEKAMMLDRGTVLFALWLIGILVFSMYHAVQYRRFYGKIMASAKPLEDSGELLDRAGTDMGLTHYPNVLISGGVQSPMLIGFAKPTIVLPYKLYGENELVMILRHELTHYKHHDLWYKLILLCANALHWFNPLVWLMNRQAGRDVEQVCDDYVVDGMDMDYRKAYSMTILNTMASQKGVALSTHLSKDAQNTKKRFAGILQPKTHKEGIAVFAAVLILAVGISGCLQVGKVDEGVALYNRVAEYLPDNAIHNPEPWSVGIENGPERCIEYIWYDELTEVSKEETYDKHEFSMSVDEKHYLYERKLTAHVSPETNEIFAYKYTSSEVMPETYHQVARMTERDKQEYVQERIPNLIDDGSQLVFKYLYIETADETKHYVTTDGVQKRFDKPLDGVDYVYMVSENTVNDRQYLVKINMHNGCIEELQSWYHNPNLLAQVESWLAVEETRLYGEVYDINWFETSAVNEEYKGNMYTVIMYFTMYYRNAGDRDTNTYLNQLKEAGSSDYQYMYDNYYAQQQGTMILKIEAEILPDGTLDMEHCKLYNCIDGAAGSTHWSEIPGLYVFFRSGEAEVSSWNRDKTQALWVADQYLQAFVQQDMDTMRKFSTVEPMESASVYMAGKGYTQLGAGQKHRAYMVNHFKKYYGGQAVVDENTKIQLRVILKVSDHSFGEDYLNLTLQKVESIWKVTDVNVEKFRG